MKRLLLPFFIAFLAVAQIPALAQPTLTAANTNMQPGDTYQINNIHNAYFTVEDFIERSPVVGPNQFWDFSGFTSLNHYTIRALDRAGAPFPNQVPGANVVFASPTGSFYLANDSACSKVLARANASNLFELIKPYDQLRFPFTFNSAFTDSTVNVIVNQYGNQCALTDSFHVQGIGYGTVITPAGTFSQALLVRSFRQTFEDTCANGTLNSRDIAYSWYVAGIHCPVLQFSKWEFSMGYSYTGNYYAATISGTRQQTPSNVQLRTFPNPATSETTMQYELKTPSAVRLVLTDVLGKETEISSHKTKAAGSYSEKLDVSHFPKGIYFIRLETEGNVAVKRLVVQ